MWASCLQAETSTRVGFALAQAGYTSAGVFDQQGRLVRTLWRRESLAAGVHERQWDQRDDADRMVADGDYQFKLIQHQIDYVWEGVIGNSSAQFGGSAVHRAFQAPSSLAIAGDRAYYAVGYNEGQPGLHSFLLRDPQSSTHPLPSIDPFVAYSMIAVDATRLYWANAGGLSRSSFVGAFDLRSMTRSGFTAGQALCLNRRPRSAECYEDQSYKSVIDVEAEASASPTGLAVQRNGRVLAVAHGAKNRVRLFDKHSGELLHEIPVPLVAKALNQLAMSPSGDLWLVSGNAVLRYTGLDAGPALAATIRGLDRPLALATSPSDDDVLWVAEGGASQQVRRYDAQGRSSAVIGTPGGYSRDPVVTSDKLCFRSPDGRNQTGLAVAADGSLWVIDHCSNRLLRYRIDAQGRGVNDAQIAYLPRVYTATVDHRRPQRVFANFLEFELEAGAPLQPGRSGKLVRNWLAGLPRELTDEHSANFGFGGFTAVETFANGRSYGLLPAKGRQAIVELPASGPLRVVKLLAAPAPHSTTKVLYENGDLGYALTGATTQSAMRLPLTGFDRDGDPVWSSEPLRLATVPKLPGSPYYRGAFSGMPPRFPVTGSGKVIFFDQSVVGNEGFHLGAAALGGEQWLWQASPSGVLDGKGSFQTQAIDGSLQYGGNSVWAHGRHILYGYHGEFYRDLANGKVGQANQFMHFDESGLFIGQFGLPSTRATSVAAAGQSGNAFSPTLVRDGAELYLYHNDESTHGGIHRWRIEGWNEVKELRGRGRTGHKIDLQ